MSKELLSRAAEFVSVFIRRSLEIFRAVDKGMRWRTLSAYMRIKLKSGWFALIPNRQPDEERLFDWNISIGNYSDFVFLFEEIFISQCYKTSLASNAPVIIDGGANIGLATLYFKMNFPGAHVSCVEPEPKAYSFLEKNVLGNRLTNVALHNKALGSRAGTVEFHWPASRQASPIAGRDQYQESIVEVMPMSSLVEGSVDLVKLDVEGAETDVIKDLVDSRAISSVGLILLEYHHHLRSGDDHMSEILGLLESAGFGYQITHAQIARPGEYQDLVLCAYREEQRGSVQPAEC